MKSEAHHYYGMPEATIILPYLILGSRYDLTPEFLIENNIGYVICCAEECKHEDFESFLKDGVTDYRSTVDDMWHDSNPQVGPFQESIEVILKAKQEGKVAFVHCMRGRSRSASTVIAYLMKENDMTLKDAYYLVKERRPFIGPHRHLKTQLIQLESHWRNESTLTIVTWHALQEKMNAHKSEEQVRKETSIILEERNDVMQYNAKKNLTEEKVKDSEKNEIGKKECILS